MSEIVQETPSRFYYFPNSVKKLTASVLDYFGDIIVKRYDEKGVPQKDVEVKVSFGLMDKSYAFRKMQEDKSYYQTLPKIAAGISAINYSPERVCAPNEVRTIYGNAFNGYQDQSVWKDFNPVPVDITYKFQILTNRMEDLMQIIEQILPWFNPTVHLQVREFDFLNIRRTIQMDMTSFATEFQDELSEQDIRTCNANFEIKCSAYFYKPFDIQNILKKIRVEYLVKDFYEYQYLWDPKVTNIKEDGFVHEDGMPIFHAKKLPNNGISS